MQFDERVYRYPAQANLHACARDRIEHPRRHDRDDAGLRFDLHEPPGATLLDAAEANATPVEGMPAIMDYDFLPDMGRMTRRLRETAIPPHGRTGSRRRAPARQTGSWRSSRFVFASRLLAVLALLNQGQDGGNDAFEFGDPAQAGG
jgi:hypothetical protein